MKRLISLSLAISMCMAAMPIAYAAINGADYTAGTQVEYIATNNESYTITVPAQLKPGQSGIVRLEGSWPDDKTINVTADKTVTLINDITATDTKILDITFNGISAVGNNTKAQIFTENVSVANVNNALFGVWSGKFNYNIDYEQLWSIQWNTSDVTNNLSVFLGEFPLVKVSDVTPTYNELSCSRMTIVASDGSGQCAPTLIMEQDGVVLVGYTDFLVASVPRPGTFTFNPENEFSATFTEAGFYAVNWGSLDNQPELDICIEKFSAQTINFTIDGKIYTAEQDMTWDEWISSKHNTGGFVSVLIGDGNYAGSSFICDAANTGEIYLHNGQVVLGADKIIFEGDYDLIRRPV